MAENTIAIPLNTNAQYWTVKRTRCNYLARLTCLYNAVTKQILQPVCAISLSDDKMIPVEMASFLKFNFSLRAITQNVYIVLVLSETFRGTHLCQKFELKGALSSTIRCITFNKSGRTFYHYLLSIVHLKQETTTDT